MKKIMIMCGTGVATSTIAVSRVREWLEEKGYDREVQVYQSRIMDQLDKLDSYDVIISTAVLPESSTHQIINGMPILTGQGIEEFYLKIESALGIKKE